jgi:hypothetical protein
MTKPAVHTVYRNDQWLNEVEGSFPPLLEASPQAEAVERGTGRARPDEVEHLIHDAMAGSRSETATAASRHAAPVSWTYFTV